MAPVRSHLYVLPLLTSLLLLHRLDASCNFPANLHMQRDDPPWYSHVRADGSREREYYIRHNVMEIHAPASPHPNTRWKCVMAFHGKLLLRRQDHRVNSYYRCAKFLFRSPSVVQMMWSHETKTFDLALCDSENLSLDPWPILWFHTIQSDYTPCPISGGYNVKIFDSELGESSCNLMHRPMRMEAECLGGEGVVFDYISDNCLPDIRMYERQKTLCVSGWEDEEKHYLVLRRNEDMDFWCLVMPKSRKTDVTAYLFSDLVCRYDMDHSVSPGDASGNSRVKLPQSSLPGAPAFPENLKFFTLRLHKRVFATLCEDEYSECGASECNSYIEKQCPKSCGVCDPARQPPTCHYPKRLRGDWLLVEKHGETRISVGDSDFFAESIGEFRCVAFKDSPPRKSRVYTTVSLSTNGCRPRYTCLKLRRLGPSALRYSLSQSFAWPMLEKDFGASICNEDRFHADPSPLDDRYHGSEKSVIKADDPETVVCNVTAVHTISATLPEGYVCSGTFFRHCEDTSKVRMEFSSCGGLVPMATDYHCLANTEGNYWERQLILQNTANQSDTICVVFNQFYPNEAYVLISGECDQKSFNFARGGVRRPLLTLKYRYEAEPCRSVPVLKTTSEYLLPAVNPVPDTSMRDGSSEQRNRTRNTPVSLVVTLPPSNKSGKAEPGTYSDGRKVASTSRSKSTSSSSSREVEHPAGSGAGARLSRRCRELSVHVMFVVLLASTAVQVLSR